MHEDVQFAHPLSDERRKRAIEPAGGMCGRAIQQFGGKRHPQNVQFRGFAAPTRAEVCNPASLWQRSGPALGLQPEKATQCGWLAKSGVLMIGIAPGDAVSNAPYDVAGNAPYDVADGLSEARPTRPTRPGETSGSSSRGRYCRPCECRGHPAPCRRG